MNVFACLKEMENAPAVTALSRTLFYSLWQGLFLAIIAAIILSCTKQTKPATRYTALSSLMLLLPVASGFTFWQKYDIRQTGAGPAGMVVSDYIAEYAPFIVIMWLAVLAIKTVQKLFVLHYIGYLRKRQSREPAIFWLNRLQALAKRIAVDKTVQLLESALLKVPAVYGHFKPVIFVPLGLLAQIPQEQVEAILLHELAHIRRNDYLVNLLQNIIETLYFFNPPLLWLSSIIRQEREYCCDDLVIAQTGNKKQYVAALISVKTLAVGLPLYPVLAFTGSSGLTRRVSRIVRKQNSGLSVNEKSLLGICCLATILFVFLCRTPAKIKTPVAADFPVGKVISEISDELLKDGLIHDQRNLSFELTNSGLLINGVRQSEAVWERLHTKYIGRSPYAINPGFRNNPGFGIFFNAVTHVFGIGTRPPAWGS